MQARGKSRKCDEGLAAAVLSAVAGFVDAAGFLALFGLFTAHLTGELVTGGLALADGSRVAGRLVMIPIFILSVAVTALVTRVGQRGRASVPLGLSLLTAALAMFCVAGVVLRPYVERPDGWPVLLIGATGVAAMGVQNALMRHALAGLTPTTIMTGNLTQVTMDLVELLAPDGEFARQAALRRLAKFGVPLVAFLVGTTIGAWLTMRFGLGSILLPTVAVAWLTTVESRRLWMSHGRLLHSRLRNTAGGYAEGGRFRPGGSRRPTTDGARPATLSAASYTEVGR
jgi:uncharacterized membrane protein YoaK (UPF0700 family)